MTSSPKRGSSIGMLFVAAGASLLFMSMMMMRVEPILRMGNVVGSYLPGEGDYVDSFSRELGASLIRSIQANMTEVPFSSTRVEEEPYQCTPRPQNIQDRVHKRIKRGKKPLIYFHKGPKSHVSLKEMYFSSLKSRPCFECEWTEDESRAVEADVVVVLYRKIIEYEASNVARLPTKYCGQLFVMLQTECPNNIDPRLTPYEKHQEARIFDISSTYRLDSDLPRPYKQDVIKLLREGKDNYLPAKKRNSKFPVAWIASRCDTTNERIAYVEELMKHIGVKSYGSCLNNAQMDVPRSAKNWQEGADAQIGRHKFYLAFENSNCDYYVTEKLYRPLKVGVIPVVMGAPQAHLYVPNNHSALFVSDFESPEALAKRMHEINNNDTLFEHYTSFLRDPDEIDVEFRNRWLRKRPPHACQLCDLVRSSFGKNFKGVPYEHWTACEQQHGTWKTDFQPVVTEDGIVPKPKITGH